MDKDEFDAAFQELVTDRLTASGFTPLGKTLAFDDGLTTIALIRLGGKMARPGTAAHILCFRHSFLRDLSEPPAIPQAPPQSVFAYPFKFLPSVWRTRSLAAWRYVPRNLNFDLDRVEWGNSTAKETIAELNSLAAFLAVFLPWARTIVPARAMSEIRKNGEDAWCERLWLDDYGAFIASARSAN